MIKSKWVSEHANVAAEFERDGNYDLAHSAWQDAIKDSIDDAQIRYYRKRIDFCKQAMARGWG